MTSEYRKAGRDFEELLHTTLKVAATLSHLLAVITTPRLPFKVLSSGLSNIIALAAGDEDFVILRRDGSVSAWGDNSPMYGSLYYAALWKDMPSITITKLAGAPAKSDIHTFKDSPALRGA